MSESNSTIPAQREIECIDPENIVIALPRRASMQVSGGIRTIQVGRPSADEINGETEPVLAD